LVPDHEADGWMEWTKRFQSPVREPYCAHLHQNAGEHIDGLSAKLIAAILAKVLRHCTAGPKSQAFASGRAARFWLYSSLRQPA